MKKEEEILTFLVNAWSNLDSRRDIRRIAVLFEGTMFKSEVSKNLVMLPVFDKATSKSPIQLEGIERWRIWRYGAFHEAMHHNMTSPLWPTKINKLAKSKFGWMKYTTEYNLVLHLCFNVVEDHRINEIGDELFAGMQPEHEFSNDFFGAVGEKAKKEAGGLTKIRTDADAVMAVAFGLWHGIDNMKKVWKVDDAEQKTIEELIEKIEKVPGDKKSALMAYEVTLELYEWTQKFPKSQTQYTALHDWEEMNGNCPMPVGSSPISNDELSKFRGKFGKTGAGGKGKPSPQMPQKKQQGSSSGGDKEGEKPKKQEQGQGQGQGQGQEQEQEQGNQESPIQQDINAEYDIIKADSQTGKGASVLPDYSRVGGTGRIGPVSLASPTGNYSELEGCGGTIQRLKSLLQKWKIGWNEYSDESGDDLDMDSVLMRHQKPFYDEKRLSPRGATYILLDMSGSIGHQHIQYKKSVAIIGEVFDAIGMKFEVAAFHGGYNLEIVKSYNEKWDNTARARLAGLLSDGGTPTADALELVRNVVKKHGISRIFVVTDGAPDDSHRVTEMIKIIEREKVRLYGIGIADSYGRAGMEAQFKHQFSDQRRFTIINDLQELPKAFFSMVESEMME